jgi:hypothetical protein
LQTTLEVWICHGKDQNEAFAQGLGREISVSEHDISGFTVLSSGKYVVVEG